MILSGLDWLIIALFFIISLVIGLAVARKSGGSAAEFFLSGRSMPWWLLGISMVATTFSADTPNLVCDIVRQNGVSGNWAWWAFLLTGMLTVFVYARLWRRSGVLTDLEFYELRYSGKPASFLRGFRAIYLGVFFNVVIMATVCVAAVKIGEILLGLTQWETLLIASIVTVAYSVLGGLRGVVITDFVQFVLAMIGSVAAMFFILGMPEVGGLDALLTHQEVKDSISLLPDFNDKDLLWGILIIPLAVQWWSVWYPGAEPGGGGYIAQRMLSAKDENHAVGATLLFNVAHYALRPWPWIILALASLVLYPKITDFKSDKIIMAAESTEVLAQYASPAYDALLDRLTFEASHPESTSLSSIQTDLKMVKENKSHPEVMAWAHIFYLKNGLDQQPVEVQSQTGIENSRELIRIFLAKPTVSMDKLGHDLGYPLMVSHLPKGLIGLVIASLIAAFMSTISTHLNWGSSYIVNDFYLRFMKPDATDKQQVNVGRISTVVLMILAAVLSTVISTASEGFYLLLQIGAGTGLIFILRWFWWRVNAFTEISGMIISFIVAIAFQVIPNELVGYEKLVLGVLITTAGWLIVTFVTPATSKEKLTSFYKLIMPFGKGWSKAVGAEVVAQNPPKGKLPVQVASMLLACAIVYFILFGIGYLIYGETGQGILLITLATVSAVILRVLWKRTK